MKAEDITIRIKNRKVLALLKELQALDLIKILTPKKQQEQKLSACLEGSLSEETADEMLNYVEESRNEWERPIS